MNRSNNHEGLPPFDAAWEEAYYRAAGLKRLSPVWAKAEIVIGLACAVGGLKLLLGDGVNALLGGVLMVLGLYLAMAGNRSHLYQSQNRQAAYLLYTSAGLERSRQDLEDPAPSSSAPSRGTGL